VAQQRGKREPSAILSAEVTGGRRLIGKGEGIE
jgi:hypothetical protein